MSDLKSTGRRLILATNTTASASSYTAGYKASLPSDGVFDMGGSPSGARYRGIKVSLHGLGEPVAANARVWTLHPATDSNLAAVGGYEAQCIATVTGSSDAGLTPTIPEDHYADSCIICDDIAVTTTTTATTPKGPGAILNTVLGSPGVQVFAPNDGATPAFFIIPDCGNPSHVYIELWEDNGAELNGFIEGFV